MTKDHSAALSNCKTEAETLREEALTRLVADHEKEVKELAAQWDVEFEDLQKQLDIAHREIVKERMNWQKLREHFILRKNRQ